MIELNLAPADLEVYRKTIVDSIVQRVEKIGVHGGVVALSGGADSSLVISPGLNFRHILM